MTCYDFPLQRKRACTFLEGPLKEWEGKTVTRDNRDVQNSYDLLFFLKSAQFFKAGKTLDGNYCSRT